ncbi:hypothetical protein Mal64_35120 [Pseudobythopirellula maris]|uniref:Uncharacterized protein n=1 Tax=Pseudobythopirellula maris TaxID=2527991 RepID=A0A5C5ZJR1_9BACT|nr:hypothetical protein [Pseudobythopirellula maris]TWT86683.1 hypothetical protein Mal64_35120 [Pseudobythopirellula maris]
MNSADPFLDVYSQIVQWPPDNLGKHDLLTIRASLLKLLRLSREYPPEQNKEPIMSTATKANPSQSVDLGNVEELIRSEGKRKCHDLAIQIVEGDKVEVAEIGAALSPAGWTADDFTAHVRKLQKRKQAIEDQAFAQELDAGMDALCENARIASEAVEAEREAHRNRIDPLLEVSKQAHDELRKTKERVQALRLNSVLILAETLRSSDKAKLASLSDSQTRLHTAWLEAEGDREGLERDAIALEATVNKLGNKIKALAENPNTERARENCERQLAEAKADRDRVQAESNAIADLRQRSQLAAEEKSRSEAAIASDWRLVSVE